jgi:hypothetical protein
MTNIVRYNQDGFRVREWLEGDKEYPFAADFDCPSMFIEKVAHNAPAVCDVDFLFMTIAAKLVECERGASDMREHIKDLELRVRQLENRR